MCAVDIFLFMVGVRLAIARLAPASTRGQPYPFVFFTLFGSPAERKHCLPINLSIDFDGFELV